MKPFLTYSAGPAVLILFIFSSGCMTPEECKEYETARINVQIKFYAHNLARNEDLHFQIQKSPCGESYFDIENATVPADAFGDYESQGYSCSLNNTFDQIYALADYVWSPSHDDKYQYTSGIFKYDTLKGYDGGEFAIDFDYTPATAHNYWMFARNRLTTTMKYCYSLPYYMLFGEPPATLTKQMLYDKMTKEAGYKLREQGPITKYIYLEDGDIVVFGDDNIPNPANAPHYAIVLGTKIYQIFPWTQGGEFDGPRTLDFFRQRTDKVNPYTGEVYKPVTEYSFFQVYSK